MSQFDNLIEGIAEITKMQNPSDENTAGGDKRQESLLGESQTGLIGAALASQLLPKFEGWDKYGD